MRRPAALIALAVLTITLTACGASDGDSPGAGASAVPTPSPLVTASQTPATDVAAGGFTVTSADFADNTDLPASAHADAFGGQCEGENASPALAWSGAPAGTVAYAITMVDTSAGNFVHWTKADIPATVTEVATGGADALPGIGGITGNTVGTYFGPCPPDANHHYVFTVYALDAELGLDASFRIGDLREALEAHTLAEASIVGIASPQR